MTYLSMWWMNDNHTFVRVPNEKTIPALIQAINKIREEYPDGDLCPPRVYKDKACTQQIEVVQFSFTGTTGWAHNGPEWDQNLAKWIEMIKTMPGYAKFFNEEREWVSTGRVPSENTGANFSARPPLPDTGWLPWLPRVRIVPAGGCVGQNQNPAQSPR